MQHRRSFYRESYYGYGPYVSVAERRQMAEQEMQKLRKKGHPVSPVVLDGPTIARTFWGQAWCRNLERYSDYSNRLPRGRSYVRSGAVVDLQIAPGEVTALVSGSALYRVAVKVAAVPPKRWRAICADCAGAIESLVELLQGHFSKGVMERICQQTTGLFPAPAEIEFTCSCPDWASMCKHVAAVFYGVGARLDEHPELLFELRKVDEKDLIAKAGKGLPLAKAAPAKERLLATDDLSGLFGLEMGSSTAEPIAAAAAAPRRAAASPPTKAAASPPTKAAASPPTKAAASPPTKAAASPPTKAAAAAPKKAAASPPKKAAAAAPKRAAASPPKKAAASPPKRATRTRRAAASRAARAVQAVPGKRAARRSSEVTNKVAPAATPVAKAARKRRTKADPPPKR